MMEEEKTPQPNWIGGAILAAIILLFIYAPGAFAIMLGLAVYALRKVLGFIFRF